MSDPTSSPPQLDYRNPMHAAPRRAKSWQAVVCWTLGGLGAVVLLISILTPSLGRARETANRVKCGSNLRQIGQAAFLYAAANGGRLPQDMRTFVLNDDLTAEVFICPSGDLTKASGTTPQAVVASMLAGDHLSYAWVGGGLNLNDPGMAKSADVLLAFDLDPHLPKDAERDTGINVLRADGRVTFVDESAAKAVRAQFVAGIRPIRLPPGPTTGTTSPPATPK